MLDRVNNKAWDTFGSIAALIVLPARAERTCFNFCYMYLIWAFLSAFVRADTLGIWTTFNFLGVPARLIFHEIRPRGQSDCNGKRPLATLTDSFVILSMHKTLPLTISEIGFKQSRIARRIRAHCGFMGEEFIYFVRVVDLIPEWCCWISINFANWTGCRYGGWPLNESWARIWQPH